MTTDEIFHSALFALSAVQLRDLGLSALSVKSAVTNALVRALVAAPPRQAFYGQSI